MRAARQTKFKSLLCLNFVFGDEKDGFSALAKAIVGGIAVAIAATIATARAEKTLFQPKG